MKEFTLSYKTNVVGAIISVDSVEEGKAIIEKLTANAQRTNSKFDSVQFIIENIDGELVYTSPRYVTSTIEDINDINNLIP